jgi:hypothetical protein
VLAALAAQFVIDGIKAELWAVTAGIARQACMAGHTVSATGYLPSAIIIGASRGIDLNLTSGIDRARLARGAPPTQRRPRTRCHRRRHGAGGHGFR